MAVVNSLAIGKAVKSAGNLTYKVSRGRTIASQRITSNNSKTYAQQVQRNKFGRAAVSMQLFSRYIDLMFEKSKYGSARNNFVKKNGLINLGGVIPEIQEGSIPLVDGFVYMFQCDVSGSPSLGAGRYTSFGSGAFVISDNVTVHQYRDSSMQDVDFRRCTSLSVSPTSGVDVSKIEIRVVGFKHDDQNENPPMLVRSIIPDSDGISALAQLGITCAVTTEETSDVVTSINITVPDLEGSSNLVGSVYAITVAVSGKIATTTGLWLIDTAEPLP